ncbi:MAG: hypothetical protein JSV31_20610 [Desulfobacterales bacterium]|nr:MAG: hypothetical protein JSV31_20610 [Desulfobacterales bacterium]
MILGIPKEEYTGFHLIEYDSPEDALGQIEADLVIYLAGADPFEGDRFGRLSLTINGLARPDQLVFQYCFETGLPVGVTLAGGYARQVQDTVDIHYQTVIDEKKYQSHST